MVSWRSSGCEWVGGGRYTMDMGCEVLVWNVRSLRERERGQARTTDRTLTGCQSSAPLESCNSYIRPYLRTLLGDHGAPHLVFVEPDPGNLAQGVQGRGELCDGSSAPFSTMYRSNNPLVKVPTFRIDDLNRMLGMWKVEGASRETGGE